MLASYQGAFYSAFLCDEGDIFNQQKDWDLGSTYWNGKGGKGGEGIKLHHQLLLFVDTTFVVGRRVTSAWAFEI